MAAFVPFLTGIVCLSYAMQWTPDEYVSTTMIVSLFCAQPLLLIMLWIYSEAVKVNGSSWRRLAWFMLGCLILCGVLLLAEPSLWSTLTDPGILAAVLWSLAGLSLDLLLMRDAHRSMIAARCAAQAHDGFELWRLVPLLMMLALIPFALVYFIWQPDLELSPRLFALVPAVYFVVYAGCVWRSHRPQFLVNPTAWVESAWIQHLYKRLGARDDHGSP